MHSQRGFALVELLLAAAVALLLAIWGAQTVSHRIADASAQHHARWMLMIRHAVLTYLEQEGERLRQAAAATDLLSQGYQDWASPTLTELKAAGLLAQGLPERVRPLGGVQIRILRDGACPGENCRIGALLHSVRAFKKSADIVDEQMMAQWQLASEGFGGMVHPSRPTVVRGPTFQLQNPPDAGLPLSPGMVAMAVSDDQLRHLAFLRVRDQRDPDFQSDASVQGNISAGGVLSVGEYLQFDAQDHYWQDSCPAEGAVSHSSWVGLLVCRNGSWDVVARSGGGFSINSHYDCATPEGRSSANPVTGQCSCPAGYSVVPISEGGSEASGRGLTRGYLCIY